ncbi:hypothetical protein TNCV_1048881 [Trichonephila clavipes]|nr:hypothetical protein TNCV_1048881 [Trichonephila clavipes]
MEWRSPASPRQKRSEQKNPASKRCSSPIFDIQNIIHEKFLPEETTMNPVSVCPHTANIVLTVPAKRGGEHTEHSPYSPDLNPAEFLLILRLKLALKGKRFDDISNTQRNVTRLLNSIPKEDFLQNFQVMYNRPQGCTVMRGDSFEMWIVK